MSRLGYVCRQFVEDVTGYLEGTLPPDVVARIDEHLEDCPHCREYLREMRRTIAERCAMARRGARKSPTRKPPSCRRDADGSGRATRLGLGLSSRIIRAMSAEPS